MQNTQIDSRAESIAASIQAGARLRADERHASPRDLLSQAHKIRLTVRVLLGYILVANLLLALKIGLFYTADFQAVDRLGRSFPLNVELR